MSHEPLLRHVLCTGPVCCPTDRQACLFVIFINLYWNLLKGFVICQSLCCIYLSYYKQSVKLLMIFKYFPWALAQDKYSPQARAVGIYDDSGSNFWPREHDESRRAIYHTIVICSSLHCVSKKRHPFYETFSKSLMVSVAVWKLSVYSGLVFVDPSMKINGSYYHDELLWTWTWITNYPVLTFLLFVHWQSWTVVLQSKVCTHETGVDGGIQNIHFHTTYVRYVSGKYYPNWSEFNGIIAEVKGWRFFWNKVYTSILSHGYVLCSCCW